VVNNSSRTLAESHVLYLTDKECKKDKEAYSTSKVSHTEKNSVAIIALT